MIECHKKAALTKSIQYALFKLNLRDSNDEVSAGDDKDVKEPAFARMLKKQLSL